MKDATRGFLPDFSRYLKNDYPIDDAYKNNDLIRKLCVILGALPTMTNPAFDLQDSGLCKKLEKFNPKDKHERIFISKCAFSQGQIYYVAFGKNPYRIVFGMDSRERVVYFFALDTKHSVRRG